MPAPKAVRKAPDPPAKVWIRIHIGGNMTIITDKAEAEKWYQNGVIVHEYDLTRTHRVSQS
jgi:hypothetical protein